MFNSGILDVVIGVVVIYLQLSLVCTAISELVALWFKKRAKELEKGIRGLLTSKELGDKFYEHPLIKGLRPDGRKPSYIPARTFSLALMDIVRRAAFDGTATVTAAEQTVADQKKAVTTAQAALDVANQALQDAQKIRVAAEAAVAAASIADKPSALQTAQEATSKEAAAQAQVFGAQATLDAAKQAKTDADDYLTQVTKDVNAAKSAEDAGKSAETALAANPNDAGLQATAVAARKAANEAADKMAPSAASLLIEAREKLASSSSSVVPPELKVALLALMDNAGTNLAKAQANVEQWFDDAMDRVSGVYKRKAHIFVVIIAVFVTVLANVDTLQVADSLSHDKAVRDSLVAAAPELAKKGEPTPTPASTAAPEGTPAATPTPAEPTISSIKESLAALNKLALPIGYIRVCTDTEEKTANSCETANKALALLKDTEAKFNAAKAAPVKAKTDLDAAEQKLKTAAEANQSAAPDKQAETKATLTQAEAELAKAKTTHDSAVAELNKAKAAHDSAIASKPADLTQLEKALADAQKAEKDSPADENKKLDVVEARKKLKQSLECPTCRKASELTEDQLTRRLPTTHDHSLLSTAGLWEMAKDIGRLIYHHWLGWLLTAMALSLGAPFWFDMLNKLIVVRSTIKPHEKSKEQESKDNPDEKDKPNKT